MRAAGYLVALLALLLGVAAPAAAVERILEYGSDIAINSSGTFQLWTGTPGSEAYANCDITAYNKTSTAFKNGKFGAVSLLNGQAYAVPYQV